MSSHFSTKIVSKESTWKTMVQVWVSNKGTKWLDLCNQESARVAKESNQLCGGSHAHGIAIASVNIFESQVIPVN